MSVPQSKRSLHNIENEISNFDVKRSNDDEQILTTSNVCLTSFTPRVKVKGRSKKSENEQVVEPRIRKSASSERNKDAGGNAVYYVCHGAAGETLAGIDKSHKKAQRTIKLTNTETNNLSLLQDMIPKVESQAQTSNDNRIMLHDNLMEASAEAVIFAEPLWNEASNVGKILKHKEGVISLEYIGDTSQHLTDGNCSKETDVDEDYQEFFILNNHNENSIKAEVDEMTSKILLDPLSDDAHYKYNRDTIPGEKVNISNAIEANKKRKVLNGNGHLITNQLIPRDKANSKEPRTQKFQSKKSYKPIYIEAGIKSEVDNKKFQITLENSYNKVDAETLNIEKDTIMVQNDTGQIRKFNEQSVLQSQTIIPHTSKLQDAIKKLDKKCDEVQPKKKKVPTATLR